MKLRMKAILLVCLLTLSVAYAANKVIYGIDNRVDVYESRNSLFVDLSESTAAMIGKSSVRRNSNGTYSIIGGTLESRGICAKERFSDQLSAAMCSGFLVAEDIIVTAGHCVRSLSDCKRNKWVFNYKASGPVGDRAIDVNESDVYECAELIGREQSYSNKNDYAVIRLNRVVEGRQPLEVRTSGKIDKGTEIVVIGHPSGLPAKIADGAIVRKNTTRIYFTTNLDTYGGNSGSAVFNAETGVVEGILVRGATDYISDPEGCMVSNICAENGCRGEDVTRITAAKELMDILRK